MAVITVSSVIADFMDSATAAEARTAIGATANADIVVGTTVITGGTTGNLIYNNAGVVGELTGSTIGKAVLASTNPSAITFGRANADNTFSWLSASDFRTAIGAGTGSGTVTAVSVATANGVSGSSSGGTTPALTIALGAITPSSVAISTGTLSVPYLNGPQIDLGSGYYIGVTPASLNIVPAAGASNTVTMCSGVLVARNDGLVAITGNQTISGTINGNTLTTGTGTLTLSSYTLTASATGTVYSTGNPQTDITGNAGTVTVADTSDSTCYVALFESATGNLGPKTDSGITYDASSGALAASSFGASGNVAAGTLLTPTIHFTHNSGSGFDYIVTTTDALTVADRTITYTYPDANTTIAFGGNVSTSAAFATTGTSGVTLAAPSTGSPIIYTLPTTAATLLATDGSGASLTALNGANISSGNIARARIDNALSANAAPIVATTLGVSGAADLPLISTTGNVVKIQNGASEQSLRVYKDTTATAWIGLQSSGGSLQLATGGGGMQIRPVGDITYICGVASQHQFFYNNATACWTINTSGHFIAATDATFDLGGASNRVRDLFLSRNATIGGTIIATPQALSGAGAVNLTTVCTDFTSTGVSNALTLADGTVGQIKTITHIVDGGSGILTPTTKTGYTTITFLNAGDSVTLRYCTTAGWCIIGIFGAVAA